MRKQETESVMTALGELRQIDQQRAAEQREAEERIAAARQAAEAARVEERAQRERAERARAEKRRLDIEIAERRAAIEAHRQVEERRVAVETEVAALREQQTRAPRHWLTVALLALVVAGQAVLLYTQSQRERELHKLIEGYETEARARTLPPIAAEFEPDPRAEPGVLAPDIGSAATDEPPAAGPAPHPRNVSSSTPRERRRQPPRGDSRPAVTADCDPNDPLGCLPKSQSNR